MNSMMSSNKPGGLGSRLSDFANRAGLTILFMIDLLYIAGLVIFGVMVTISIPGLVAKFIGPMICVVQILILIVVVKIFRVHYEDNSRKLRNWMELMGVLVFELAALFIIFWW